MEKLFNTYNDPLILICEIWRLGDAPGSRWSALIFIIAVVAAFLYNVRIMTVAVLLKVETP
jgi:hypothetical protein